MELKELHIGDLCTGVISEGNTVSGSGIGICGEFEKPPPTTTCQNYSSRAEFFHCTGTAIKGPHPLNHTIINDNLGSEAIFQDDNFRLLRYTA
jgi:hypothetical protein